MNGLLKLLCASAAILVAALVAEQLLVPHVVATAWGHDPRPLWQVETAFLLKPVEYVATGVAVIALAWMTIFRLPTSNEP